MKNIRKSLAKLLSTLVSIAVILSLVPTMAFADEGEFTAEGIEEEAVYDDASSEYVADAADATDTEGIADAVDSTATADISEDAVDATVPADVEEYVSDEPKNTILGNIAYCTSFKNLKNIKKLSDIPEENLIAVKNGPASYDETTGEIMPYPFWDDPMIPRGMDYSGWDVYAIGQMSEPCVDGENVIRFNTSGESGDLVFVAVWENAAYVVWYEDLNGEALGIPGATGQYIYDPKYTTWFVLPPVQSESPDDTKEVVWTDGDGFYLGGVAYIIPADTVGAIGFREVLVKKGEAPGPGPTPTPPGEYVPTKNGVAVALNEDGDKTVTLMDGANYGKKATINTIKGTDKKTYKITQIADGAFKDDETLISVSIGTNVKSIGDSAFEGCNNLKTATIGSKVEAIGANAFNGCESLKSFNTGAGVRSIGASALEGCTSLKTLTIGASTTTIGEDAFKDCDSLSSLTVNMANTPNELFKGQLSLTKVKMGATARTIGDSAFDGCTNLASLSLGSKLESIGDRAFAETGIKKANISGRVESVGQYAFSGCQNLTSASTGKYVKTIDAYAFYDCQNLKSASIGANVEAIGDRAFANCVSLKSTTIGKSVTRVGRYAYEGDSNLATVKVNSKNLTSDKSVGVDFLNGIKPTATIKLPKSVFEDTKSLFEEKSGAGDQVKYKKF